MSKSGKPKRHVSGLPTPSQCYMLHLRVVIDTMLTVNGEVGVVLDSCKIFAKRYSLVGTVIRLQTGLTMNRCSIPVKRKKSFFSAKRSYRIWWLLIR
jgi:hypothetical protein